jgi:hypothetical protein
VGFILVGSFWALVGLGTLITGKATINYGFIELSGRKARIFGAATVAPRRPSLGEHGT